jgi:hypothetical protein
MRLDWRLPGVAGELWAAVADSWRLWDLEGENFLVVEEVADLRRGMVGGEEVECRSVMLSECGGMVQSGTTTE